MPAQRSVKRRAQRRDTRYDVALQPSWVPRPRCSLGFGRQARVWLLLSISALAQSSCAVFILWERDKTHSVEQQLALLGWTGVPVTDRPATQLAVTDQATARISELLRANGVDTPTTPLAVIHPTAAFDTKQWATDRFARVAESLSARGFSVVAITAGTEAHVAESLKQDSSTPVIALTNLSLPEVTALVSRARYSSVTLVASRIWRLGCARRL